MNITFGSVCSGIEAASVAWHPLGWRAAWLAEIEASPSAVLAHHYPDVPNVGDMTKIAVMVRDHVIPAPDVFCGGTPCQAFSIAGLRNSLDDARGNLSLTFCEIANEIDAQRATAGLLPAIIFWENVPGVLSTKDSAFGCFLAGLAGEDDPLVPSGDKWTNAGCVFGPARTVAWRILDAQYFGVAQRRRRVFVVASAREGFDPTSVLFEFDGVRRDTAPSREAGQNVAHDVAPRTTGGGGLGTDFELGGGLQPVDVCPTLRAGGNTTGGHRPPGTDVDTCESLIPTFGGRFSSDVRSVALRGREGGATAELGVSTSHAIQAGALRTNPKSGPDGIGVQAHIAYTLEARAEVQAVVVAAREVAQCMTNHMAVRRLTPVECARLQGFDDDYLAQVIVRGKPMADGPQYKALGNSWAVPVVRWIGERIQSEIDRAEAA
jgi:DNA (cytosine-5)-methyltransferase 1